MAEIRVAPRKKGHGWVWLVLALLVVAAVVYFLYVNGTLNFAPATTDASATFASTVSMPSSCFL